MGVSVALLASLAFDDVDVLRLGHSNRCVVVSLSLMTCDMEHLFICLFSICLSSLAWCLLRPLTHFLVWVVCVFILVGWLIGWLAG